VEESVVRVFVGAMESVLCNGVSSLPFLPNFFRDTYNVLTILVIVCGVVGLFHCIFFCFLLFSSI